MEQSLMKQWIKKFTDNVLDPTLQLTSQKLPFLEFWFISKKTIRNYKDRLRQYPSLFQRAGPAFLHVLQPKQQVPSRLFAIKPKLMRFAKCKSMPLSSLTFFALENIDFFPIKKHYVNMQLVLQLFLNEQYLNSSILFSNTKTYQ